MGGLQQSGTAVQIMTDVGRFTDEMLAEVRTGNRNVMVTIGWTGLAIAILNPQSAAQALERYREIEGSAAADECTVSVMGFDDALRTYEISVL